MVEAKTVYGLLAENALRIPAKTAVVDRDQRISYRELKDRADRLALGLRGSGLRRGDHWALCLRTSLELVVAFYALAGLRAVTSWINPA
ncbi:MAG: long-chain fatty acid--CoA ligase, partial [Deltaproteobacteria bacterium]|nr:long-chain fatty acid--CoA ligase [Deltaproteobacteria bacterium]